MNKACSKVNKTFNKHSPLVSIHMVGTGFQMFWRTNSHLQTK